MKIPTTIMLVCFAVHLGVNTKPFAYFMKHLTFILLSTLYEYQNR